MAFLPLLLRTLASLKYGSAAGPGAGDPYTKRVWNEKAPGVFSHRRPRIDVAGGRVSLASRRAQSDIPPCSGLVPAGLIQLEETFPVPSRLVRDRFSHGACMSRCRPLSPTGK